MVCVLEACAELWTMVGVFDTAPHVCLYMLPIVMLWTLADAQWPTFAKGGAVDVVLTSLHDHVGDPRIQCHGLRAVANLAPHGSCSMGRVVAGLRCHVVVSDWWSWGLTDIPTVNRTARHVLSTLKRHTGNVAVHEAGLRALVRIAHNGTTCMVAPQLLSIITPINAGVKRSDFARPC